MMIKRMCKEQPKNWNKYIDPLLFSYREVPQESTGFAPFEIMFGRPVRGPITLLQDLWTNSDGKENIKSSYEYVMDIR